MLTATPDGSVDPPTVAATIRRRIGSALADFLATRHAPGELRDAAPLHAAICEFVSSPGKQLRGMLCYWGWCGGGGQDSPEIFRASAALEMFHAAAMIHDDVLDGSDTRRGAPSLYRQLAALAPEGAAVRASDGLPFGVSGAVLAGDLCLAWAGELLNSATADPQRQAETMRVYHEMTSEVMLGQYQDVVEESRGPDSLQSALAVTNYKAARYTFQRPLQIGGALVGASPAHQEVYSRFGIPAGEAFQLRDDMLGVFGDPEVTGKSNLDDIRAGKATPLIAVAIESADDGQRARITKMYGDRGLAESDAAGLRALIAETGAPERVERMIAERVRAADDALRHGGLPEAVTAALLAVLDAAVDRTR